MEVKKISFGFSKTTQQSNLLKNKPPAKEENKVELIKCLEENEIKLVEEQKAPELLVIPLKENQKTSAALASLIKRRAVLNNEELDASSQSVSKQTSDLALGEGLEMRAARELLSEVNSQVHDGAAQKNLVLPVIKPDDLPLEGAEESTFDDYEAIPVEEFGRAMLRGMGWVEPLTKKDSSSKSDGPMVRPKGMGLGADKVLKPKPLLVQPEKNEVLEIKNQAFVRILGGKYKDMYGQIEGFDDYAGRVIVKMAIGSAVEVFNEFLCQPVAKNEYAQYSKCINIAKYEAYKKFENEHGQIIIPKELQYEKNEESKLKNYVQEFGIKKEKQEYAHERKEHRERDDSYESYTHKNYRSDAEKTCKVKKNYPDEESQSTSSNQYGQKPSSHLINDLRYQSSSHRERKYSTDDSGDSSFTDVDSHKRRQKKKSNKSSSNRTSKKSTIKLRDKFTSDDEALEEQRSHKNHKKKTKKSKRERSRSCSRGRK